MSRWARWTGWTKRATAAAFCGLLPTVGPLGIAVAALAATPFDGVVATPHHLALAPEEVCLVCHTGGPNTTANATAGAAAGKAQLQPAPAGRPAWVQQAGATPFTLEAQPVLGAELDYHPSGPSTACLACHDGALAVDVHGIGPEVELRQGNTGGLRVMDHPDSILYPRRPDGTFQTERTPPHISRYFTIPDRPTPYGQKGHEGQTVEMPHGPVSPYLLKASGLTSVGPETAPLLVRTSAGRIYCDSCHNPHVNRFAPFLRGSPKTICLVCHDR